MQLIEDIAAHAPEMAALRRQIHAHPELNYEEVRTAALVAAATPDGWRLVLIPLDAAGVERVAGVFTLMGSTPSKVPKGVAGDTVALGRLETARTGETLNQADSLELRISESKLGAQVERSNAEDLDMVQARGIMVDDPTGSFRMPRRPFLVAGFVKRRLGDQFAE